MPHSNIDDRCAVVQVVGGARHANSAASSITNAHSIVTRPDTCPDRPVVMSSIDINGNIAGPDANVHPASINVDAAVRHFDSSVTNSAAVVQQGLQQQLKAASGARPCQWQLNSCELDMTIRMVLGT
jgi:metal-dependent amidase/aminoacylase/carboxypeptidase family protein